MEAARDRHGRLAGRLCLIGAAAFATGPQLIAQDQELRPLVEELQAKNAELEARLATIEGQPSGPGGPEERYALTASYQDVRVTFQLFGDVGFAWSNPEPPGQGQSSFAVGTVDAFVTAQMGNHFQVLSETVLTGVTSTDGTSISQERLWGAWTFEDRLYAKVGLEHSPLTLWNRRYHHGAWLEPTITRPLLASFEGSSNGFLPLHNSGVELGGHADVGSGMLDYTFIVSNGRGSSPTDKQRVSDENDPKALVGSLGYSPFSGLFHVGIAAQGDDVPASAAATAPVELSEETQQTILTAFVETELGQVQLLGEVAAMQDTNEFEDKDYDHLSWYLQAIVPFGRWSPYLRYDVKDMDEGDPYLAQDDKDLDQWRGTVGIRNDFATNAALKLEIGFGDRDERATGGAISEKSFILAAFQLAWAI